MDSAIGNEYDQVRVKVGTEVHDEDYIAYLNCESNMVSKIGQPFPLRQQQSSTQVQSKRADSTMNTDLRPFIDDALKNKSDMALNPQRNSTQEVRESQAK